MDLAHDVLLFLHLIGFAALFGGLFTQLRSDARVVSSAVVHGALTQLVTGLLLVGVNEADDTATVDHAKIGVKLVVLLVIAALVLVNRKSPKLSQGVFLGLLGLTVLNAGIAVFW
jgi:hypothetical protein